MNRLILPILFVAAIFSIMCCQKDNTNVDNSQPAQPAGNQTVTYGDTSQLIFSQPQDIFTSSKVSFTKKEDSRCPSDVQCISAGTVRTEITLDGNFTIKLELGKPKDTLYQNHLVRFKLLDVKPYPNTSKPVTTDTAIVSIKII